MAAQLDNAGAKLVLEDRSKLTLTGATEVLHFDEELAELNTRLGPVVVDGREMKLKCLSLEQGLLVIQGTIRGFRWEEPQQKRRLWR